MGDGSKQQQALAMTVSAVVIVRNGAARLERAINSIVGQARPVDEIIVVVGESNDRTREIADSFAGLKVIDQGENVGIASARNIGIAASGYEWVAFLDHDDVWRPEKIEQQLNAVEGTDCDVCTGMMQMFVADEAWPQPSLARQLDRPIRLGLTPSALVVRRSLFASIGCFDPSLKIGCDADWIARSQPATWCNIDKVVVEKEIHDSNISGDVELNGREMLRVAREHLRRQELL
ncbi:MAG: glycosyltransferase family 2 protein [Acidimicrobiales bacterium]